MKSKKNIILTIDYEVFLGDDTGDMEKVLINPTYQLMDILKINNSKMTVFWDILHYYRIVSLCKVNTELIKHKELIEKQISDIVEDGHDIQLHLHPHWLDAKFENGKWIFDYSRFSLHKLSQEKDKDNINTIYGCVYQMKNLMESFIRPIKKGYKVNAFRAGGYLIDPFFNLKDIFEQLEIKVDSSVCTGLFSLAEEYNYDFRGYPDCSKYNFSNSPSFIDRDGFFTELPIHTIYLPIWLRALRWLRRKVLKTPRPIFVGSGVRFKQKTENGSSSNLYKYFSKKKIQLTTDGADSLIFRFLINRSPENSIMIVHPKLMSKDTFIMLRKYIFKNKVKFFKLST